MSSRRVAPPSISNACVPIDRWGVLAPPLPKHPKGRVARMGHQCSVLLTIVNWSVCGFDAPARLVAANTPR
jgi:hypothetical protein